MTHGLTLTPERPHFRTLINIPLDRNAKGDYDYINNINKPLKRR